MTLRTSEDGFDIIKKFEGCKLKAYRCPAGVWTIGYGHTTAAGGPKVSPGMKITQAEAEEILRDDIDRFEDQVERDLGKAGDRLSEDQFDALVSLAFNIGPGAFAKSTLLKLVKAGKFREASAQFMRWNKAGGRELDGLTRRRRAESALFDRNKSDAKAIAVGLMDVDMPQAVDEPEAPKTMATSTIGNGTLVSGGLGTIAAANEVMDKVNDASQKGLDFWQSIEHLGPWAIVLVVILAAAALVYYERHKKLGEGV